MTIPIYAGKLGIEIVKKLKFGKSFIGKKSKEAVTTLGNKKHFKSAKVLDAVMTKGNKGINYGVATAKNTLNQRQLWVVQLLLIYLMTING